MTPQQPNQPRQPGAVRSAPDAAGRRPLTRAWLKRRYVDQRGTAEQIAAETSWSSQYVRDRLREYKIPLRPRGAPPGGGEAVDAGQLRRWIDQGLSVQQIASRCGYSRAGVYKQLQKHGLAPQARTAPARRAPKRLLDELADLYLKQQLSLTDIGTRYGHGTQWVRDRLTAAGVTLRGRGDTTWKASLPDLVRAGLTTAQIAAQVGRSSTTVLQALRAAGLRARQPRKPLPDPALLRRLYVDQQHSIAEIAERLGVPPRRISRALAAADIPRRPAHTRRRVPSISATELRRLYQVEHLSIAAIAHHLGCSDHMVRNALRAHDIPVRTGQDHPPTPRISAATLRRLYVRERRDDAEIAARCAVPTDRIRQLRRRLGIHRPAVNPPHPAPPASPTPRTLARLYQRQGMTLAQIAHRYHTSSPRVRAWLDDADIKVAPRTSRAERRQLDLAKVRHLYVDREWTATDIAAELDTTVHLVLRTLHDNKIPVRPGGGHPRQPRREPPDPLLEALYSDDDVQALLRRHRIPARPAAGPIADRFPVRPPLTRRLLREAYQTTGLAARHIELLTGHPADQILDALHSAGIPVRRPGLSPWSTRQRHEQR